MEPRNKTKFERKEELSMAKGRIYDGKTNIGGIGTIEGPYTPKPAPKGSVITGGDLRSGNRGGKKK